MVGHWLKANGSQSLPSARKHKNKQQPCYSKLQPQVDGMEFQSLASIFAYCLKGGLDKLRGDRSLKRRAEGEHGRKASGDHTISSPQTLSFRECHGCNQPFHPRGLRSSTSATQEGLALKFKGFRQLGAWTVTICTPLSFSRDPQPQGLLLRASTFFSPLHEVPRVPGLNWKTAYGKAWHGAWAKSTGKSHTSYQRGQEHLASFYRPFSSS